MTAKEAIAVINSVKFILDNDHYSDDVETALDMAIEALKAQNTAGDTISRQAAIDGKILIQRTNGVEIYSDEAVPVKYLKGLPSAQPDSGKYEYHYDHTDCIWYRPEARNRCPTTCAQYRDGWNDAMNYIFRDGKGYRPYRRDKQYEE